MTSSRFSTFKLFWFKEVTFEILAMTQNEKSASTWAGLSKLGQEF